MILIPDETIKTVILEEKILVETFQVTDNNYETVSKLIGAVEMSVTTHHRKGVKETTINYVIPIPDDDREEPQVYRIEVEPGQFLTRHVAPNTRWGVHRKNPEEIVREGYTVDRVSVNFFNPQLSPIHPPYDH